MRDLPDRRLAAACLVGVFERTAQSMLVVLIPLWALRLHATAPTVGLIVAVGSLAPMILGIGIGGATDRLGPRRVTFLGGLGSALGAAIGAMPSLWLLGASQLIAGLGRTSAWIGAQTAVTESAEESGRAGQIGWLSLGAQIGNLSGPALAGLVWTRLPGSPSLLTATVPAVAIAVCALALPRPKSGFAPQGGASPGWGQDDGPRAGPRDGERPPARSDGKPPAGLRQAFGLLSHPGMRLLASATVIRLALIGLKGSFYIVLLDRDGFSAASIGLILSLSSVAAAISAPATGPLTRWLPSRFWLFSGLAAMIIGLTASPFAPSLPVQIALMLLVGWGTGITQPTLIDLLAASTPPGQRGLAIGLRTTLNRLAQFVAPALFGALAAWTSLPALFVVFGAATALGLGLSSGGGHRIRLRTRIPGQGRSRATRGRD